MNRLIGCAAAAVFLGSAVAAGGSESWIGRWAASPEHCGFLAGDNRTTSALTTSAAALDWGSESCRIGRMYKSGTDVFIQARCSTGTVIPVELRPRGDMLNVVWNGQARLLRRCK